MKQSACTPSSCGKNCSNKQVCCTRATCGHAVFQRAACSSVVNASSRESYFTAGCSFDPSTLLPCQLHAPCVPIQGSLACLPAPAAAASQQSAATANKVLSQARRLMKK